MIRRAVLLACVPVALAALVAGLLAAWRGPYQLLCAGVAVGLIVPAAVATLVLAERLSRASLYGPLVALAVGTAVRLGVGFGGAVAVFFATRPAFLADPISFCAWVLGVYLTTLVVETALLARAGVERRKA